MPRRPASHLSAVLFIGLIALSAPALFGYMLTLSVPLFGRLLAADSAAPSWFAVAGPLLKLVCALLGLGILAEAGALAIRRTLLR